VVQGSLVTVVISRNLVQQNICFWTIVVHKLDVRRLSMSILEAEIRNSVIDLLFSLLIPLPFCDRPNF